MRCLTISWGANARGGFEYHVHDEYGAGPGALTFEEALGFLACHLVPRQPGVPPLLPPWRLMTDEQRAERAEMPF